MTTPRTRRTPREQAGDILERLYAKQMETAGRDKVRWEQSVADAERTKAALTALGVAMRYGMEVEISPGVSFPTERQDMGLDPPSDGLSHWDELPDLGGTPPESHPRRQRIGGKAQRISDVWSDWDERDIVTVHTALMYKRQERCALCRDGVPFATAKRTEHHLVTRDEAGVERGFEYKPCTGIKETHENRSGISRIS